MTSSVSVMSSRSLESRAPPQQAQIDAFAQLPCRCGERTIRERGGFGALVTAIRYRIRAGEPKAFEPVGMSRVTSEFAPTMDLSPIVTPI